MMPVKADLAIYWCVWIVQECGFHVKPLFGFQFLQDCSGFCKSGHNWYGFSSWCCGYSIVITGS